MGFERSQRHCRRLKERVCLHRHRVFESLGVAVRYDAVLHCDSLSLSLFVRYMALRPLGLGQILGTQRLAFGYRFPSTVGREGKGAAPRP